MRIGSFPKLVGVSELDQPLVLQNNTVVVDGLSFFFDTYKESGLPLELGCKCHRYASYLREYLSMFKKANITCYFLFRGGHSREKLKKRLNTVRDVRTIYPIFMNSVYREVLDEMGFHYVTCEYESKKDIIALAQTLDCPVISYDIELCFSGVRYIPQNKLKFDPQTNTIVCRYFLLDTFMQKYNMTPEKLAIFIALLDEHIFPKNFFINFFKSIKAALGDFQRNKRVLKWLSENDVGSLDLVLRFMSDEVGRKFLEELAKAELMINRQEEGGLGAACALRPGAACALRPGACHVARGDPLWFAKGVAAHHIASSYVTLYRSNIFIGGHAVDQDDPLPMYLEIVYYALDLLTNFENEGFKFVYDTDYTDSGRKTIEVPKHYSIRKPDYKASVCVFENGWGEVRERGLFEHFLKETLQLQDLRSLARLPEDARLLVIALHYFSRKKNIDTSAEAACVLLSYVTLTLVLDKCDRNNLQRPPFAPERILDCSTDKNAVTVVDCNKAAAIMKAALRDGAEQVDQAALDLLAELQQCLSELNDLNALCGAPFRPTVFSRAYSGSLVHRLRRAARAAGDTRQFLRDLLSPAPTVYAFLKGLIEVYEQM